MIVLTSYMTSDNRWDPLDIQLPHHSSLIEALECNFPQKYTDNSEYDVLEGIISSIYNTRLAEGLSDEAVTVLAITTKERHSKVDAKTLAQIWRFGLGPAQQTLKATTQFIIRYAFHPLTLWYKTDIIHG